MRAAALEQAAGWQRCTRRALKFYLANGYRVTGYFSADGRGYYVLGAQDPTSVA